ncbi:MAG: TrkH family potassium uptake protein [Alphaproteobacteria bacterium]|nr:TrkH family potassium uptake protein [Alphaproteobacteria bacterium]
MSLLALAQLVPFSVATVLGEADAASGFFASLMICFLTGGSLFLGFRSSAQVKVPKLTVLLPVVAGVSLSFVSGLPFFFIFPELGLVPAYFEGVSLLTTTGSSAYEGAFKEMVSVTLWRALAAWIGGFVSICFVLSILTAVNSGGLQLHRSTLPFGDSETGYPRLRSVATTLVPLYCLVTAICCVGLLVSGETLSSSIMLSMAVISTTGITPTGTAVINGLGTQVVVAVFMLVSILNWDVLYARVMQIRAKHPYGTETKAVLLSLLVGTLILFAMAFELNVNGLWQSLFATISAMSTSGFSTDGMAPSRDSVTTAALILLVLACLGGAAAGTGGGMKQLRLLIIYRLGRREVDRLAHPHGVKALRYQGFKVEKGDVNAVWLLIGAFVLTLVVGTLCLAVLGIEFQTSLAMAASSLTLSGPLANHIDPYFVGFSGLRDADYAILSILMLVGRLEATLFLAFFAKSFWRG